MTSRALASIALGAAVILGATGCNMISPQATTIPYSAAEGINIDDASGPVKVRNLFIVADESGENGNLIGSFINNTDEDHTVSIQIGEGSDAISVEVEVAAKSTVALGGSGDTGADPLPLEGLNADVGATVVSNITSGGDTVMTHLTVLDGKMSYLKDLAPKS
ncbi:DNA modification methylase [Microbacterium sp. NC79]|uniref:DNA modification methylase n=1 Tax=Microbacterium sp. NC79 TaxID=2851009 RepID=UPI001C2C5FEB|nr:DNA modification methylase [Microbacterium sp. NC79]